MNTARKRKRTKYNLVLFLLSYKRAGATKVACYTHGVAHAARAGQLCPQKKTRF